MSKELQVEGMSIGEACEAERGRGCLFMHIHKWEVGSFLDVVFLVLFTSYSVDNHQLIQSITIASKEGHVQGLERRENLVDTQGSSGKI